MEEETQKDQNSKWLRVFLDREQPLDAEALSRALQDAGNEKLTEEFRRLRDIKDLAPAEQEIWQHIQSRIEQKSRRWVGKFLKYAAVILLLLGAGAFWLMQGVKKVADPIPVASSAIAPGQQRAYLLLPDKKQIDLLGKKSETLVVGQGVEVHIDSSGKVSYQDIRNEEKNGEPEYHTLVVPCAGEYYLELNDGTRVWMNAASELRYPVAFSGNERKVQLKGEAYFEVARDTTRPFFVEVDDMAVKVLGTSFNVNAYRDHGNVLTTLVSGKVEILDTTGKSLSVLRPDEQADFSDGQLTISRVDVAKSIAWRTGRFYFKNMVLEDIMLQIQRWYDVEVFFASDELKKFPFTGIIQRDLTIDEIFAVIEKTTQVKFNVNDRCVTVGYR